MQLGKPSQTAWTVAFHRAAHQSIEEGRIFTDPLAVRILGQDAESVVRAAQEQPTAKPMRIFVASRTRFAEDALAKAAACGTNQLVVLGAGLDTYAYRTTLADRVRIFEVDHPDTQAWKRGLLEEASIATPPYLTFVPLDFERHSLAEGLGSAGFDFGKQTFFTWLGVVPYLREEAVWTTLHFIAQLVHGAHVVFDYSDPPETMQEDQRSRHERRAARVAGLGERWITYFTPGVLREKLLAAGFADVEDLGPPEIAARYFPSRAGIAREKGGHIVRASTVR
ncbi:MAG TPA: SAM-dependent methyltransferase [Bryobacteraceae bacterium]|nr:SAM-dependent methyltransferase [Bryobacteraceae bacterium]